MRYSVVHKVNVIPLNFSCVLARAADIRPSCTEWEIMCLSERLGGYACWVKRSPEPRSYIILKGARKINLGVVVVVLTRNLQYK